MLLDVTLGVLVTWMMVRFFDILFEKLNLQVGFTLSQALVSGNYFVMEKVDRRREYFISYRRWVYQCILWCLIATVVVPASARPRP